MSISSNVSTDSESDDGTEILDSILISAGFWPRGLKVPKEQPKTQHRGKTIAVKQGSKFLFVLRLTGHMLDMLEDRTKFKSFFLDLLQSEKITVTKFIELFKMVKVGCMYSVHLPLNNRRLIVKRDKSEFVMLTLTAPTHPDAGPTGFVWTKKHPDTKGIIFTGENFVMDV